MNTPHAVPCHVDPVTAEVLAWLEGQCHKMEALVGGLDDAQLRATPLPSGWSMLGLLGHVRDSTEFWLHHVLLGHPTELDEGAPWDNDPDAPGHEVVVGFVASHQAAVAGARALRADAEPGWWPDGAWGGYRQDTVRGVLMHLFADNAAHVGQLGIVRELTDGGVWDYGVDGVRTLTT
ncbi:DinB family protein [Terrabacter sp. MAHUQ-38]|uniref:DinB family protein n=1 Tax=unclassified Terrabacter TaxID=2630222 RepID=UPI00165E8723|nr:DinB family protein [Terrabacter sp. MAHUQ-38]MBC9823362.1 DUF664 domain-containing protein [Terrabacter sp. MAHUQ-38]